MDTVKKVKIVGIGLIILGTVIMGASTQVSEPDTKVEIVEEFDFSYAQSVTPTPAVGSYTTKNITAEDVHKTYNMSDLNDSTQESIRVAREEGRATFGTPTEIERGRFIVRFDTEEDASEPSEVVFESQPDGVTPSQVSLTGMTSLLGGFIAILLLKGSRELPDEIERASKDSRWEYNLK
jgi:hypothetical protein